MRTHPIYVLRNALINEHCVALLLLLDIHRESKKGDTILLSISLLNIHRFSHSSTDVLSWKFAIKLLIKIPPHLRSVATLPCEMLKTEKLAII